jgi:hypothetical protein
MTFGFLITAHPAILVKIIPLFGKIIPVFFG